MATYNTSYTARPESCERDLARLKDGTIYKVFENVYERHRELFEKAEAHLNGTQDMSTDDYAELCEAIYEDTVNCNKQDAYLKATVTILAIIYHRKRCSIRKKKGSYSIREQNIDAVISAIICGENVEDACRDAGITAPTLYNRMRARGITDIRGYFKEKRKEMLRRN